jgi:predicted nucleic acid-binding protein
MTPYADTNFFTRLYLQLPESPEADALFKEVAGAERSAPFPVTWLHRIETANAFQLHVFFGRNTGQIFISPEQAALAYAAFSTDLNAGDTLRTCAVSVDELQSKVEELSLRHTARHGFRTYDLLHIASALLLNCDRFWSFDPKASKLAQLEGLKVRKSQ